MNCNRCNDTKLYPGIGFMGNMVCPFCKNPPLGVPSESIPAFAMRESHMNTADALALICASHPEMSIKEALAALNDPPSIQDDPKPVLGKKRGRPKFDKIAGEEDAIC